MKSDATIKLLEEQETKCWKYIDVAHEGIKNSMLWPEGIKIEEKSDYITATIDWAMYLEVIRRAKKCENDAEVIEEMKEVIAENQRYHFVNTAGVAKRTRNAEKVNWVMAMIEEAKLGMAMYILRRVKTEDTNRQLDLL